MFSIQFSTLGFVMLEQSPSTEAVLEPTPPGLTGAPPPEKFARSRSQRIGIGGIAALVWIVFIVAAAVIIPMVVHNPVDPGVLAGRGLFKVSGHPLGGDSAGNDMLLQLAKGARSSMIVALGAVLFGLAVGGTLGLISGYYRGRIDTMLTSVFNILLAIPQFVLAVALVSVLANDSIDKAGIPQPVTSGRRLLVLVVALGIVSAPILARITRANTLQWAQRDFVLAARAQGAKNRRIMVREVLPNVMPAMFSIALLGIAVAMVAEGGLSILGVGVHLPGVSWGSLIAAGRNSLQDQPSVVFEPIICLFLTVLSLNYLGDVVRARFDVRESVL
jgi:peptide/nickel transport system permease protein